jgi:hypothetical protein
VSYIWLTLFSGIIISLTTDKNLDYIQWTMCPDDSDRMGNETTLFNYVYLSM